MFAHCYKNQAGWEQVLARWPHGGGTLLDLEFLTDANGRRVAAFGYHAGFAGAALGLQVWAWQKRTGGDASDFPAVKPFPNEAALLTEVREQLEAAVKVNGSTWPRVIVIGALGRCGSGAVDAAIKVGIPDENVLKWDMAETAHGGPFPEILECMDHTSNSLILADIFVNCIYLSKAGPLFLTFKDIENHELRQLSVVADVSCDTTNPHNPIPIYSINTTFEHPVVNVETPGGSKPLSVISIDHLPTMLPRESSEAFSSALLESLLALKDRDHARVWTDAEKLFKEKVATLPGSI
jgi:saccharopine dehydrogenase (NAD+, L-lysine-forming)